ncbi:MAG: hypothetical protein SPD42_02545, partial [Eubacteriales bacterium]|nr:hypothetical protein [Eubacteriales bacterium]
LQLAIQPKSASDNLLSICEVETVEIPGGQAEVPFEINLLDPSTREAQAYYGNPSKPTKKSMYLTAEYFINDKLFPQIASVTFSDGTKDEYTGKSGYDENGGVAIVWDASSVDLTTSHSKDRRLIGYVYGYVMNKVVYVVPVYTKNSYAVSSISGLTYDKVTKKFLTKGLTIDMKANDTIKNNVTDLSTANNKTFNVTLPENVQITFGNGNSYTFSTHYADYAKYGTPGREAYETYAEYLRDAFDFKGNVAQNASGKDTFTGVNANYPVGKITWNEKNFVYDFAGGTVTVSYTFSWGLTGTFTESLVIPIKNYKIGSVSKFAYANDERVVEYYLNSLQGFDSSKLVNYDAKNKVFKNGTNRFLRSDGADSTMLEAEAVNQATAVNKYYYTNYAFDLYEYVKAMNRLEGYYAPYEINGVAQDIENYKLDLRWSIGGQDDCSGLKPLKDAIDKLYDQTNKCWNYFKGIDVIVTGYVGGGDSKTFFASKYFKGYPTDTATTKYVAGTVNGVEGYWVYQALKFRIKVASTAFEKFSKADVKIDPYEYATINEAAIGNTLSATMDKGGSTKSITYTLGQDMKYSIPSVNAEELTYMGYTGSGKLKLGVTLGTKNYGYQTASIPITIRKMTASGMAVDVENSLDPNWSKAENLKIMEVSFAGGIKHTMSLDWDNMQLYSDSACTKKVDNIFKGGTFYAKVRADKVELVDGKYQVVMDADGKNPIASYKGASQAIRIAINATEFGLDTLLDGAVAYNGEFGTIDIYKLVTDKTYSNRVNEIFGKEADENYWGNEGRKVTVKLNKEVLVGGDVISSITAYVRHFNIDNLNLDGANKNGEFITKFDSEKVTIGITVGNREFNLDLAVTPHKVEAVNFVDGSIRTTWNAEAKKYEYRYDVLSQFDLPNVAEAIIGSDGYEVTYGKTLAFDIATRPADEEYKVDGDVKYVERKITLYGGTALEQTLTIKIILENVDKNGEDVDFDFDLAFEADSSGGEASGEAISSEAQTAATKKYQFTAFDSFALPNKGTIKVKDGSGIEYKDVDVTWDKLDAPTAAEIVAYVKENGGAAYDSKNGYPFTRKATMAGITKEIEFVYYYDFEIVKLGGAELTTATYEWNEYKMDYVVYNLPAAAFFDGLPKTATVNVKTASGDKTIDNVAVEWFKVDAANKVVYGEDGVQYQSKPNAWIRLSLNGFATANTFGDNFIKYADAIGSGEYVFGDIPCGLTVERVSKEAILEQAFKEELDSAYVYDVLGLYDITPDDATQGFVKKLFNNNEVVNKTAEIKIGDGAIPMNILATLSYQLPSDVLTAPNKYFGTSQEIVVKIQSEQCVIEKTIKLYYLDRTVKKVANVTERSLIFDPYRGISEGAFKDRLDILVADESVKKIADADAISLEVNAKANRVVNFKAIWDDKENILKIARTNREGYEWPDNIVRLEAEAPESGASTNGVIAKSGAKLQVRIPVYLINRTIDDISLVANEYTETKFNEYRTSKQYVYVNDDSLEQIMTVTFDNETHQITKLEFKNPYTYSKEAFPTKAKVTFSDGQVMTYNIVWSNVPEKADGLTTTKAKIKASIVIGSVDKYVLHGEYVYDKDSVIIVDEFEFDLAIKGYNLTRFNSDVASKSLDTNYNYEFYPYATTSGTAITMNGLQKTVYNPFVDSKDADGKYTYYANNITAYLDGQWVKVNYLANYIGYKTLTRDADGNLGEATITSADAPNGAILYRIDPITRRYESGGEGTREYVYVYNVSFKLNVDEWDLSDVSYSAVGGTTYAKVKFGNDKIAASYRTPVKIVQSTFDSFDWSTAKFAKEDTTANNVFKTSVGGGAMFDPWLDEKYTTTNADKYFPNKVTAKFTDGTNEWTQEVNIAWNFNNLEIDMTGGDGYTKVIIGSGNEYDVSKYKFTLRELNVTQIVKYIDKTITFDMGYNPLGDNSSIKSQTGFAGAQSYGDFTKYTETISNIDPYNYTRPTMPTSLYTISKNGVPQEFTEEGTNGYKLVWDYSAFYPSYVGGETQITAQLTVPSGLKQEIKIKYYVYKMMISKLASTHYTADVDETGTCVDETGKAKPFTVTPFDMDSYTLPTSYKITFETSKYDGEGFTKLTYNESRDLRDYNYVQVSMPSSFKYEFTGSTTNYLASIKVGSQQRVNVTVQMGSVTKPNKPSGTYPDNLFNTSTQHKAYVVTRYGNIPIAYIGYAVVYSKSGSEIAAYKLTISSASDKYYLPKYSGHRKVKYFLKPIYGVMVDKNGMVLTTRTLAKNEEISYGNNKFFVEGDEIPQGYCVETTEGLSNSIFSFESTN